MRGIEGSIGYSERKRPLRRQRTSPEAGLTLVELIVTVAILAILASAAVPVTRFEVKRAKERELRRLVGDARRNRQV
jgi:prepilin-type N-terminal cleavage/methylation domain-containing protein